jgi:hypothetical protein
MEETENKNTTETAVENPAVEEAPQAPDIGPPRIGIATFFLKIFAGIVGGVGGSLVLLAFFILASSVLTPLTQGGDGLESASPSLVFILLIMVFLSSTASNIASTWLLAITERDKYKRLSSSIYQIFTVSIIIFLLMVPVYLITAANSLQMTGYAVALHIFVAAQASAIILEIVSNYRHSLVGFYGVTFGILISAAIMFGISVNVHSESVLLILLFGILPIVWASIAFTQSIFTMVYGWIARTYDKDFLSTQTLYGDDYGKDVESEEEQEDPKAQDEAGANFLRHN